MKESTLEIPRASMPTWETLEAWVRAWIQDLLQGILEEEVTEALGRTAVCAPVGGGRGPRARATAMASRDGWR